MQSTSLRLCLIIFYLFPNSWRTVSENYFSRKVSKIMKPIGFNRHCALFDGENEDLKFWYLLFDVTYTGIVTYWSTIALSNISVSKLYVTSACEHYRVCRDCNKIKFWTVRAIIVIVIVIKYPFLDTWWRHQHGCQSGTSRKLTHYFIRALAT